MADYYESCLGTPVFTKLKAGKGAKEVSNWLLGEVSRIINAGGGDIGSFAETVGPASLVELIAATYGTVNQATGKSVLEEMSQTGKRAAEIIEARGLSQISDSDELEAAAAAAIAANPQAVTDYRAGKESAIKFLVGQVMKATRGRANPNLVNDLLKQKLEGE
jgi:aspartyl-tRNA(Asn)/glutamyl-tRNA(Gln) amidotransferase subunit B